MSNTYDNKKPRKLIPAPLLIPIDIIAAGLCLCVFALFHHALPQSYSADLSLTGSGAAAPGVVTDVAETAAGESGSTEAVSGYDTAEADGLFTSGEVVADANSYKNSVVNITFTSVQQDNITYYVEDIYIKDVTLLRTAFANDTYGKAITAYPLDTAMSTDAIAAINGDYYGMHSNRGVVIRNGIVYRADEAYGDVCLLYSDGTMTGVTESEFNSNGQSYLDSVWQGWCFGPILVQNGIANSGMTGDIASKNPRTAIGYFEPGHYCFVTVDGRQEGYSVGMTLDELATLMASLGCEFAFNLDGGKSSVMIWQDAVANEPYESGRNSSDIIYISDGSGVNG